MTQLTTKNVNGKEVPVLVKAPVDNGESANNVEIKDMQPQVSTPVGSITLQSFMELYKQAQEIFGRNVVETSMTVTKKSTYAGRQKTKTENNLSVPVLDENGEFVYYPDSFFVTADAKGRDIFVRVTREEFDMIQEGGIYIFKGHMDWVTNKDKSTSWSAVYTSVVSSF